MSTVSRVILTPNFASRIDVPLRPYQANLLPRFRSSTTASGVAHPMRLRGGVANAGQPHLVFLSASGEAPATPFGPTTLPLVPDLFTQLGFAFLNAPSLPATAGVLDAAGEAPPGFDLSPFQAALLAGRRFTFAGVVLDPSGTLQPFGPSTLRIDD